MSLWIERRGLAWDIAAPNGAVVATVGAETLAVVGEPDGRVVIFGAGKQEVAVAVVFQECEWPFMAFHQNRSHGFLISLFSLLFSSLWLFVSLSLKKPVVLLCVLWRKEINRDGTGTYARFRVLQSSRSARIATLCIIISLLLQPIYIVGLTLFEWAVSKISVLLFSKRSTLF